MKQWSTVAANTVLFVAALLAGTLAGVWATANLSLRYWQQYAAIQLGVALAFFVGAAVSSRWTVRDGDVLVPAALVAAIPTMLNYADCLFTDNSRSKVVDIVKDVWMGAKVWPSWAALAFACMMSWAGLRLGQRLFRRSRA